MWRPNRTDALLLLHAPAKLNLGLVIRRARPDGYHEIETILVPLRLFDRLEIEQAESGGIQLEVINADLPQGPENLVVRAAELACRATGLSPALRIRLEKRIPVAAGLGGGSSDAAATLLGVEALAGRQLPGPERRALALSLGADVPFFLKPQPALARGVGEQLEPIAGVPELWWLLVAFPFQISTREAYRAAASELTLPREESSIAALLGSSGVTASPINDLEDVAVRRHLEIGVARRALRAVGATITGMSGSGPTVYGTFDDRRAAEDAALRAKLPEGASTYVVSSPGDASGDWGWGVAKR